MSLRAGEILHVGQIAVSNLRRARAIRLSASRGNQVCSVLFLLSMRHTTKGKRVGDHRLQMT